MRYQARVFSHVRIADTLDIESSGIAREEYGYTFRAHFDFVITRDDTTVIFAVEFDGPLHDQHQETRRRDSLKNALCRKLGMPLIRLNAAYLRKVERFTVLSWLVEMWFIYEGWCEAQAQGQIPQDEPFTFFQSSAMIPSSLHEHDYGTGKRRDIFKTLFPISSNSSMQTATSLPWRV